MRLAWKRALSSAATEAMNARRAAGRLASGGPSAERHAATLQGPPVLLRLTHCAERRATPRAAEPPRPDRQDPLNLP